MFMSGGSPLEAIFLQRRLLEIYREKKEDLHKSYLFTLFMD